MSNFDISQKIKADKVLESDEVKQFIKDRLSKSCKFKILSETDSQLEITGAVKETLFTPVTKFKAIFFLKVKNDTARISINGTSSVNWIFWILFLVGLFTGIFLLIGVGLFLLQRNKPKETLEGILRELDTEFSSI